jgi:hypothetical protein
MRRLGWITLVLGLLLAIVLARRPSRTSALKGQVNTTTTFYGLVVDQDGRPLPDATIVYSVEAYPRDWTFETRGRPYDLTRVTATSDAGGRFQFKATGCGLGLLSATRPGYRRFYEQDGGDGNAFTDGYQLIAWGDPWYRPDVNNPAVFVFVKNGASDVSARVCRGGDDWAGGKYWTRNKPQWPKHPSLSDVVYKPSVATGAAR